MPNYVAPGTLGASLNTIISEGENIAVFNNEAPAAGQASQQLVVANSQVRSLTGLSIEADWTVSQTNPAKATPSAAVVVMQIANTDEDSAYVTVSTLTFTGTQSTLRDDPAGLTGKFVRAKLVSHTGTEALTVLIGH